MVWSYEELGMQENDWLPYFLCNTLLFKAKLMFRFRQHFFWSDFRVSSLLLIGGVRARTLFPSLQSRSNRNSIAPSVNSLQACLTHSPSAQQNSSTHTKIIHFLQTTHHKPKTALQDVPNQRGPLTQGPQYCRLQENFPPILEVGPKTVHLWMNALNLGVARGSIERRLAEVIRRLRETTKPYVTKQQCDTYQSTHGGPNLTPPVFSFPPAPGSLGGPRVQPGAANNKAHDLHDHESEALARELQRQEYAKAAPDSDDEENASGLDAEEQVEEEVRPKKKVKKTKEEKMAKKARKAKEEEERKAKEKEKQAKRERKDKKAKEAKEAKDAEEDALFDNPIWSEESDEWQSFSGDEDLQTSPSPRPKETPSTPGANNPLSRTQETPSPPAKTPVPAAPVKSLQRVKKLSEYDTQMASVSYTHLTLPTKRIV